MTGLATASHITCPHPIEILVSVCVNGQEGEDADESGLCVRVCEREGAGGGSVCVCVCMCVCVYVSVYVSVSE